MIPGMQAFFETELGRVVAKNGVLALVLAWTLYVNWGLTEKIILMINSNTAALIQLQEICKRGAP